MQAQLIREKFEKYIFYIVNVLIWSLLFSAQCIENGGDYYLHNMYAELLMQGKFQIAYPGYHLVVGGLHLITGLPTILTAIPVLVLSQTSTVILTGVLMKRYLMSDASQLVCNIAAMIVNIMLPIFYLGMAPAYSSCNTYVSPTQIAVKPFVILSILLLLQMEAQETSEQEKRGCRLKLLVVLLLSCVVKPVFAMAFIPALGIYYGLRTIKGSKSIKQCIVEYWKQIWPLFFCGLFLLVQYWYSSTIEYNGEFFAGVGGDSAICIGWLHSWAKVVDNVWLSLIYAYIFPLVYFAFGGKRERFNNYWKMTLAYAGVSFLYMSCLYQTGRYEMGVNFRNAWIFTFYLVQAGCVSGLYRDWKTSSKNNMKVCKLQYFIPCICLLVQCVFGGALVIYKMLPLLRL